MANEYVDWFVNREKQRKGFLVMLKGGTPKQIMVIKAPTEMGKTWLIQHMYHDCRSRSVPVVVFDFSRRQPWDLLTIVRQARDQFGDANFNHLTQVINDATDIHVELTAETVAVNVNIENSQITDSTVNAEDIRLTADKFQIVRTDSDVVRRNLELRISDAFLVCLKALAQGQRVVFLLDSVELTLEATMQWFMDTLLWKIRDGQLPGVLVIIAGRTVPDLDPSWNDWVAKTGLDMFEDQHIIDFIARRGLQNRPELSPELLMMLSRGHPGMLGKMADNALIAEMEPEEEPWI